MSAIPMSLLQATSYSPAMILANAPATGDDGTWTPLGTEAFNEKIRDTFDSRRRHGADYLDSDRRTGGLRGVFRSRAQGLRSGHDRLCRDRAQGRQSEHAGARVVHHERRPCAAFDPGTQGLVEGQADQATGAEPKLMSRHRRQQNNENQSNLVSHLRHTFRAKEQKEV